MPKIHFKGFNGLRFFAAYLVVISHAESAKVSRNLFNLSDYSFFNDGGLAVQFFFVLSGFLITYLLLQEYQTYDRISIKDFYIRRILRIWPLYFILVILGVFLIPFLIKLIHFEYVLPYNPWVATLLYIFFMPFMVNYWYGTSIIDPLWSIGVEEQFYLMWAPLVKFFRKYILWIFSSIIFVKLCMQLFVNMHTGQYPMLEYLTSHLLFELMSLGGVGAYFIFNYREKVMNSFLFTVPAQIFFFIVIALRIFLHLTLAQNAVFYEIFAGLFGQLMVGFLFLWLLVNISLNPKSLIRTDYHWLDWLGEISYGIYMYHLPIVFFIILLLKKYLMLMPDWMSFTVFHLLVFVIVVVVSYLSKHYVEDWFLRLKHRFAKVESKSEEK